MLIEESSVGADDEAVVVGEDGMGVDLVVDCDVTTTAAGAGAENITAVLYGVSDVAGSENSRLAGMCDTTGDPEGVIVESDLVAVEVVVPASA